MKRLLSIIPLVGLFAATFCLTGCPQKSADDGVDQDQGLYSANDPGVEPMGGGDESGGGTLPSDSPGGVSDDSPGGVSDDSADGE